MKTIGMLFVCVLVGCGGSSSRTTQPAVQPAAQETTQARPLPDREAASYQAPKRPPAPAPTPAPPPAPPDDPEPIAEAPPPRAEPARPTSASAELKAVKGGASVGTVTFERGEDDKIVITGEFTGLKKNGVHAFYIHERGDCGNAGKKAGGHLNPTKSRHGPPASSTRHAGDFGNLMADEEGNAKFSMVTDSVTLEAGRPDSVIDRAVIVHTRKDSKNGDAGPALACGVIRAE